MGSNQKEKKIEKVFYRVWEKKKTAFEKHPAFKNSQNTWMEKVLQNISVFPVDPGEFPEENGLEKGLWPFALVLSSAAVLILYIFWGNLSYPDIEFAWMSLKDWENFSAIIFLL